MKTLKGKKITFISLNLFIFIGSAICFFLNIFFEMESGREMPFMYYFTTLSNIYAGIMALILAIYSAYHFDDDNFKMNRILKIFHLTSATSLALTFVTTVLFLTPMVIALGLPLSKIYGGYLILFHVINPIIHIITYMFFYKSSLRKLDILYGIIPMGIYTIFYSIMVATHNMVDIYNFTFGGHLYMMAVMIPLMLGVTYLLSFLLFTLNRKFCKKYE